MFFYIPVKADEERQGDMSGERPRKTKTWNDKEQQDETKR